jgi:hypothetical protein
MIPHSDFSPSEILKSGLYSCTAQCQVFCAMASVQLMINTLQLFKTDPAAEATGHQGTCRGLGCQHTVLQGSANLEETGVVD